MYDPNIFHSPIPIHTYRRCIIAGRVSVCMYLYITFSYYKNNKINQKHFQ